VTEAKPEPPAPEAPKAEAAKPEAPKAEAAKGPAPAGPAKGEAAKGEPPKPEAAKAATPAILPATVVLDIRPWGEVIVNGKAGGVSPPTKTLKLAPGKYRIEIRNTTFAAHVETLELKSRDELTVRHTFR
jgi:hypothetical protein